MCRTWVGKSRGGIERVRLGYGPTNPLAILSTFIPCLQRFATRKTRASINNLNSIYVPPPPPPGPHVLIKNPRGVSDYRQNSSYFIANSSAAIVPRSDQMLLAKSNLVMKTCLCPCKKICKNT